MIGRYVAKRFYAHPLLVVGVGRSGTSVLLRALGKHPAVLSALGESPFVAHLGACVHDFELTRIRDYRLNSLQITEKRLHRHYRRLCFEAVMGSHYGLKTMAVGVRRREFSPSKTRYWCAKTLPQREGFEGLRHLYPSIKAVYIVRSGIENVHSRMHFHSFRDRLFSAHCKTWAQHVEKFRYLVEEHDRAVLVRHETLVADPEQCFRRIFALCGLAYDDSCVRFVQTNVVHPLGGETQEGVKAKNVFEEREPVYESWTSEQRSTFERLCGDAMQELGYEIPFSTRR